MSRDQIQTLKQDLAEQYATEADWIALAEYEAIGYPVLHVNTTDNIGIESLHHSMRGKTNILLCRSGVGKSSILNPNLPSV